MPTETSKNRVSLSVKGFKRVNEFESPETIAESDLVALENCVLDNLAGVPTVRNGYNSYNANGAYAGLASLQDIELGGSDYFVSPQEWSQQRNIWQQAGYDVKDFDNAFSSTFIQAGQESKYALTSSNGTVINY